MYRINDDQYQDAMNVRQFHPYHDQEGKTVGEIVFHGLDYIYKIRKLKRFDYGISQPLPEGIR